MRKALRIFGAMFAVFAVAQFSTPSAMAQTYIRRYAVHITSATTTTVLSSTAYISSMVISVNSATTATIVVKNKEGTAKALYTSASLSAPASVAMFFGDRQVVMTSGIDITTTGTINVDVFITYYI